MLRLFHRPTSSCSFRVRIGLNLKKLSYERIIKTADDPKIAELNPQGKVPFLQAGEVQLSQSLAILEWLEEEYPDRPALLPKVSIGYLCLLEGGVSSFRSSKALKA